MNRYVIPDIHGCFKTFSELLQKISLTKSDELYLLGDYIDRGPHSSKVLDLIIELKKNNYKIFPIMGNHENNAVELQQMIDTDSYSRYISITNNSADLLENGKTLKSKYEDFIVSLPYYYLLNDFILVHAGLNTEIDNPFDDIESILQMRDFEYTEKNQMVGNRKIIHGHDPTDLDTIKEKIDERSSIIPLDNGCVYSEIPKSAGYGELGNLLCLNLYTYELTIQKNIDL